MSRNDEPDELMIALRALPPLEPDGHDAERIRFAARSEFVQSAPTTFDAWIARAGRWYSRFEPVFATAIAVSYLGWAVRTAAAFMR